MMKKIIIGNWKMNPASLAEAKRLFDSLNRGLRKKTKTEVVACPPFVYLQSFKFQVSSLKLGAQDCFWEQEGAFTGEISPFQLKDLGVKYVLIGHSERREVLGESDEIINKKLKAVLKSGLLPVFCLGETTSQRKQGTTFKQIEKQLKQGLKGLAKNKLSKVVFAYEPVWAIGSGKACSVDQAVTVSLFLRKLILKMAGKKTARSIKVLYGGSVSADNAGAYLANDWLDGLLVGGASLEPKEFLKIVQGLT